MHDEAPGRLLVQYCEGPSGSNCTNRQLVSSDLGETWEPPTSLASALGAADGTTPGPGAALQLRSSAHHPGRLIFCGHKADAQSRRISPIWTSDDGGRSYRLRAVLPRGSREPFVSYGPDECSLAELADGTVVYRGRNNYYNGSSEYGPLRPWRLASSSRDGGDTWAAVGYDAHLGAAHCEGALASTAQLSQTLYYSSPTTDARTRLTVRRSDDGGRTWPRALQVYAGGASYSSLSPMPPAYSDRIGLLYEREGPMCDDPPSGGMSCRVMFAAVPGEF